MTQHLLAEKLRVIRAQQGLTVLQAAEKIGIDRHTLRDLELGRRRPNFETMEKVARGYGVSVGDLLEERSPVPKAPSRSSHEADEVSEEERRAAEVSWQAEYEELGEDLASRWEDELEQKLALADNNPEAFFTWVEEVRHVERAYLYRLVSTYMVAVGRLEAVIGVASFMSRRRPFWRRFEEVTLTRPEDQEQQQKIVEEVKAEEETLLAA